MSEPITQLEFARAAETFGTWFCPLPAGRDRIALRVPLVC